MWLGQSPWGSLGKMVSLQGGERFRVCPAGSKSVAHPVTTPDPPGGRLRKIYVLDQEEICQS